MVGAVTEPHAVRALLAALGWLLRGPATQGIHAPGWTVRSRRGQETALDRSTFRVEGAFDTAIVLRSLKKGRRSLGDPSCVH